MVEVKIPSEHMVNKNLAVKATQLWGTDVYTDESDVVAVLMHTGFFNSAVSEPPPILAEVQVFLRILPAQATYQSSLRNSVTSRTWQGEYDGLSYAVERCVAITARRRAGLVDPTATARLRLDCRRTANTASWAGAGSSAPSRLGGAAVGGRVPRRVSQSLGAASLRPTLDDGNAAEAARAI